jgi:hypothetical protein
MDDPSFAERFEVMAAQATAACAAYITDVSTDTIAHDQADHAVLLATCSIGCLARSSTAPSLQLPLPQTAS